MKTILLLAGLMISTLKLSSNTEMPENNCSYCIELFSDCMNNTGNSDFDNEYCKQELKACKVKYGCK